MKAGRGIGDLTKDEEENKMNSNLIIFDSNIEDNDAKSYEEVLFNAGAIFNFGDKCELFPELDIAKTTYVVVDETDYDILKESPEPITNGYTTNPGYDTPTTQGNLSKKSIINNSYA